MAGSNIGKCSDQTIEHRKVENENSINSCHGQAAWHWEEQRPALALTGRHEVFPRNNYRTYRGYGPQEFRVHSGEVPSASKQGKRRPDAKQKLQGRRCEGISFDGRMLESLSE